MSDDEALGDDYRIHRFLRTAQATVRNPNTPDDVRATVNRCIKNILLNLQWMSTDADERTCSIIFDMMDQSFFIGRYAPAADLASFIESMNQHERGKKSPSVRREKAEQGWKLIARHLATSITADGTPYSANRLGNAIIAAWGKQQPSAPDIKTIAPFLVSLAAEPGSSIVLKTDGERKKIGNEPLTSEMNRSTSYQSAKQCEI